LFSHPKDENNEKYTRFYVEYENVRSTNLEADFVERRFLECEIRHEAHPLFEWNEEVNRFPEGIVEIEDVVLYPSLAMEHPGVVLGQDKPLPLIKEELVPHGHAEDAAACNALVIMLLIHPIELDICRV
jgi:hypothetical protein